MPLDGTDHDGLMRWITHFQRPPRRVFLTHGEEAVARKLAGEIAQTLKYNTYVPQYRETIDLE